MKLDGNRHPLFRANMAVEAILANLRDIASRSTIVRLHNRAQVRIGRREAGFALCGGLPTDGRMQCPKPSARRVRGCRPVRWQRSGALTT
jgi:hypothetical protein